MSGPGADILVVLPCLNEADHLPRVLATLLADPDAAGALFVVADGGSTDGTREWLEAEAARNPRVICLPNPKRLQSAGVNLAARRHGAGRRWLVRVDVHADYPERFVSRLVATAERTGAQSVAAPMLSLGQGCFQRASAAAQNSRLGTGGAAHRRLSGGGWVDHGHHALFTLADYLAAGGYDEGFAANEDAELDVRLTRAGARIWLADDLAIGYYPRRTPGALFRQYLKHGAGRARTLLRHRIRPKLRQLVPVAVAPAVLMLLVSPLLPALALPALFWAGAALGYGVWLGVKARDRCAMLSGVAAMTMHLAWSLGFWSRLLRGAGPPFTRPPADALAPSKAQ